MFDFVGVLIVIVLVALFGFLTTRAWKLKNALLKWMGVILSGLLTLISTAVLVLALIGFYKLNVRYSNPVAFLQVAPTSAQIARGEKLAYLCVDCHTPDNQLPLAGTNFAAKFGFTFLGTFYAPNLTPSGDIKDWSDGEVVRAIREGIYKDGRSLLAMPSANFRNMSDTDVQALIAFLRSQPATGGPTPSTQFGLLGALFMNMSDFRTAQQPAGSVTAPQAGTPEYGKYLVAIAGCHDCHGAQLQGGVEAPVGPPAGPNLTKLVPFWTEGQFMTFFNTGTLPGGGKVPMVTLPSGFSAPKMPWPVYRAATTDDDLKAIFAYLHSLPPVESPAK